MSRRRWGTTLWLLIALLAALPVFADSQARIVRLSDIQGTVQIDRNLGQGYEKAFLNMPVVAGTKLQTKDDGRAEVEFEDGSTLRITPNTAVEFSQLGLRDSGDRVSQLAVREGTAYINFNGKKGEEFTVAFARENVSLTDSAHFRVQMNDAEATLAVFKGDVSATGPAGTVQIDKKQTATFDLANNDKYELAKNLEEDPFDAWDKQQEQYHQTYVSSNSYGSPYAYGMSDLAYYGAYSYIPGYGMVWQPYFAGAGWDPFMNGAWMWYPGFGYTWVSAYPWGWMPYRYGNWAFIPGNGWFWQPGNYWAGWNTLPRLQNPPQRYAPPAPPGSSGRTTVVINRGPANPAAMSPRTMIIRNDSAGLGVPRGSVRNLGAVSSKLEHGSASSTTVRVAPPTTSFPSTMESSGSSRSGSPRSVSPANPRASSPSMRPMPRSAAPAPHRTPR
jgi:hypothetical protein